MCSQQICCHQETTPANVRQIISLCAASQCKQGFVQLQKSLKIFAFIYNLILFCVFSKNMLTAGNYPCRRQIDYLLVHCEPMQTRICSVLPLRQIFAFEIYLQKSVFTQNDINILYIYSLEICVAQCKQGFVQLHTSAFEI